MITIFTAVDLKSYFRNMPIEELADGIDILEWNKPLAQSEFAVYSNGNFFFIIKSKYGILTGKVLPISKLSAMLQHEVAIIDYPYGDASEDILKAHFDYRLTQ